MSDLDEPPPPGEDNKEARYASYRLAASASAAAAHADSAAAQYASAAPGFEGAPGYQDYYTAAYYSAAYYANAYPTGERACAGCCVHRNTLYLIASLLFLSLGTAKAGAAFNHRFLPRTLPFPNAPVWQYAPRV